MLHGRAFDHLLIDMPRPAAFELLQAACDEVASMASDRLSGYFELIEQLLRLSDTTEMPRGLEAIIATHPDLSGGIAAWYRRVV